MKKTLSILLTLAMLATVCSAMFVFEASAEASVIKNTSPAITANVGDKITFADYAVTFDGDAEATSGEIVWKNGAGETVTEFTPEARGTTVFTAAAGAKTKNIYVVAKNASEKEYVLFEDDFSSYSTTQDMLNNGYTAISGTLELKDGMMEYGNIASQYAEGRILLPKWLGDFGDYSITADVKISTDKGRWFGPVYRIMNSADKAYYPYYHICIRQNTTASNGLEFGGRNVNNAWSVMKTHAGTVPNMTQAFHSIVFTSFGDTFQFMFDGEEIFYTTQEELAEISRSTGNPWIKIDKGYVGFIASGTNVFVKRLKVVIQETALDHPEVVPDLINIDHDETNIINPLANVQAINTEKQDYKAIISAEDHPSQIMLAAGAVTDFAELFALCNENKVIPNLVITAKEQLDAIHAGAGTAFKDVTLVCSTAELCKYARTLNSNFRTGLYVIPATDELGSKEAEAIRKEVRGAPATFCVMTGQHATLHNVHELQALALAVWVMPGEETDAEILKAVTSGANGIITTDSANVTRIINKYFAPNTMSRVPILIGHRGNPSQKPENSLASFRTAMENGADVFEIDVEITKDGHIIIMHDNTLNRTTNYTGNLTINQMTLEEIRSYNIIYTKAQDGHKVGDISDEKVPTLEEVLDLLKEFPDCRVFIEFKGSNSANIAATSKIVKEYGMEDRADVISFSSNFVSLTQQAGNMPGMSTGLLGSTGDSSATMETALENFFKAFRVAQIYNSTINNSGVSYKPFMTVANDRGMTVWPWTYQYSSNNSAFLVGAAGITTDDVQWAKKMYKYLKVDDVLMEAGGKLALSAAAQTFGNGDAELDPSKLLVTVVEGEDVVKYADGKIEALKDGTAKLLVGTKTKTTGNSEYVLYAQPVTVTVGKLDGLTFVPGCGYSAVNSDGILFVTGVNEKTDWASFKASIVNLGCTFTDKDGKEIKDDAFVGTGARVELDGTTYCVIVKGDVNSNGKIDPADYAMVKRSYLRTYTLNDLQTRAADLNGNGKIDSSEYAMIKRHCLGTYVIN